MNIFQRVISKFPFPIKITSFEAYVTQESYDFGMRNNFDVDYAIVFDDCKFVSNLTTRTGNSEESKSCWTSL